MQFSPGENHHNTSGFILATHSRGTVRLWDSLNGSSAIQRVHGFADLEATSLGSGYKRYAWAPDGSRLLTRIHRETKVWSSVRGLVLHIPVLTRMLYGRLADWKPTFLRNGQQDVRFGYLMEVVRRALWS